MHEAVDAFLVDLRRTKYAPIHDALQAAFNALDIEGDTNPHATVLFEALTWVIEHNNRTVEERLNALWKLVEHDGREIELHAFLNWPEG